MIDNFRHPHYKALPIQTNHQHSPLAATNTSIRAGEITRSAQNYMGIGGADEQPLDRLASRPVDTSILM